MKTILNIGLARNDGEPDNGILHVVAKINQYGFIIRAGEIHEVTHAHGTERTLIAEVKYTRNEAYLPTAVYHLSQDLAQDCIAIANQSDNGVISGAIYGPKAAEWGEFDPRFFVGLSS
ncbi:hypothetical protein KZJ38_07365 [Paraburkholderia edwinii]|uniref:Uncharacterized protein n=1 Tax=Paraburkholderia edwinii TaxID=2861782 RepID=A0ABX8UT11_9BURK|nr:hypothetical protein [Paraburkholderia edwinii]QYD70119.1 hypothetical protein KZJ38_07365 [Paraburkholderia edwinii]